jgi:hypothetical protein
MTLFEAVLQNEASLPARSAALGCWTVGRSQHLLFKLGARDHPRMRDIGDDAAEV